jgi:hypothetical protein
LGPLKTFVLLAVFAPALSLAQSGGSLKIVVTEGDGAINNISAGRAKEPVVFVKDALNRAVVNAAVTFAAPAAGPGGVFAGGSPILSVTTDAEGRAVGRGFRPNRIAGPFEVRVTASENGRRASATLRQTNAAVARSEGGRKRTVLLAVIGAAAAAAVIGIAGSGSSSPAAGGTGATAPPRTAVLTPGSPTIGAP